MTQTARLIAYVRSHPGASCAVCSALFHTPRLRGWHERREHPDWTIPSELRASRDQESRDFWTAQYPRSWHYLKESNKTAARRFGHAPIPLETALPEGPCFYCGGTATGWDHVVALARGGAHNVENLVPSCWPCNDRKSVLPADIGLIPGRLTLPCAWCWTPVSRVRSRALAKTYISCSNSHTNLIRRWAGLPFGNPLFAGPRSRLEPVV